MEAVLSGFRVMYDTLGGARASLTARSSTALVCRVIVGSYIGNGGSKSFVSPPY